MPDRLPDPPGWGFGVGLTTPSCKKFALSRNLNYRLGTERTLQDTQEKTIMDPAFGIWNTRILLKPGSLMNLTKPLKGMQATY